MYVCIYVYIYVCIYIYECVYIYTVEKIELASPLLFLF